jgi:hypothetical protein
MSTWEMTFSAILNNFDNMIFKIMRKPFLSIKFDSPRDLRMFEQEKAREIFQINFMDFNLDWSEGNIP